MSILKIDMHSHIIPKILPDWSKKFGYGDFIHLESVDEYTANMMKGNEHFRTIKSNCWNSDERIQEYQTHGIEKHVACTIPVLFSYHAKAKDGLEISRFLNDHLSDEVSKYPNHLIGLGTLPLQDTDLSIQELLRLKNELNLSGIQIGSNINDVNLDDERFFPLYEVMNDLELPVMVHPWNMMGTSHIKKYWLPWLVGMPAETTRAICSLIFGGVMEKFPKIRWNFSHAGGSFIFTLGRIKHGFDCRPDLVAIDNQISPEKYLRKFWVDSITHDPKALRFIIDNVGIDKVTFGTDYPFPLGDLTYGKFISEENNFSNEEIIKIFSTNTLNWLKLN